ncbi:hypothetical protein BJ085DRAFT_30706 [Dimargaris cristalligena]|uniref:Pyrroline-5-carboxylate reductase catalytic N-terminal domain-containing protein n=1 Tax=Dimargaris cristalligena TaxID=215637 RepID=A0A4Q0A096_9FUNG|nr:hypothetical protein BJ085DRAFT_30706 [Dimargaris cristalligena]|eukprot:RKP39138.1 hypothetical protein BJ085DRAFT_30706 [Dimargaris cristalligena]
MTKPSPPPSLSPATSGIFPLAADEKDPHASSSFPLDPSPSVSAATSAPFSDPVRFAMHDKAEDEALFLPRSAHLDRSRDTLTARPPVAILGAGWFGRALCQRLHQAGYTVHVGRRRPTAAGEGVAGGSFPLPVLPTTYFDAIESARVIFLTIPHRAHPAFVVDYAAALAGKILVDVSNPDEDLPRRSPSPGGGPRRGGSVPWRQPAYSIAEQLAQALPQTQVVKAFNTLSAYQLEHDIGGPSPQVLVCTDYAEAQREIMNIVRTLGYTPVDAGTLRMARDTESINFRFFPGWWGAVTFTVFLFLIFFLYDLVALHLLPGANNSSHQFSDLPYRTIGKVMASTALVLLASTNLAGVTANLWQLAHRTAQRPFPAWLANWLAARKALGLLAFMLVVFHVITSAMLTNGPAFALAGAQVANAQGSLLLATLGVILYGILCVTSIPGVGSALSWTEWRFIQSTCGWWALALVTAHSFILRLPQWQDHSYYHRNMPPLSILTFIPAALTLFLKVVLLLPPVAEYLEMIQNGR